MKLLPFFLSISIFTSLAIAETPPNHPPVDHKAMTEQLIQNDSSSEMNLQGKVVKVISVESGYVYIEVDPEKGDENIWIALPDAVEVKEGDTVHYNDGPVMKNFQSKSLNRTFSSVMFLSSVKVTGNSK